IPKTRAAQRVHSVRNSHEVLEELGRDVLVRGILSCQFERHREHSCAIERHPRRSVRLLEASSAGQWPGAVEDPDIVKAQKAAGENVLTADVLAIHPPGE